MGDDLLPETGVHQTSQGTFCRQALDGGAQVPAHRRDFHRHGTHPLGILHARNGRQFEECPARLHLGEGHRHIIQLAHPEAAVHQIGQCPALQAHHHDQPAHHGQTDDGQHRPARPPFQLAQHHARRLRQPLQQAPAPDQPAAKALRSLWPHGLCHRLAHRTQHGQSRPCHAGQHGHQHPRDHQPAIEREIQLRKAEVFQIGPGHPLAHPAAGHDAQQRPRHTDHRGHQPIVQHHGGGAVAKGLQDGNLPALHAHQTGEHHVQQKGRHPQKDGGQHADTGMELAQLVIQPAGGELVHASDGPQPAPAVQHPVDAGNGACLAPLRIGLGREPGRERIEGAIHVHAGSQCFARHPQHRKMLVVRKDAAGRDLVQIFGRAPHAHGREPLAAPVDRHPQAGTGLQVMEIRKGIADHHLVPCPGGRHPAPPQEHAVLPRLLAIVRQRHQLRLHRLVHTRQFQFAGRPHPRLDLGHLGQCRHLFRHAFRCPLERHPHVRQVAVVHGKQLLATLQQRAESHLHHGQHGNAGHHHPHDGDGLPAQQPQVAQRLAVDGRQQRAPYPATTSASAPRGSTPCRATPGRSTPIGSTTIGAAPGVPPSCRSMARRPTVPCAVRSGAGGRTGWRGFTSATHRPSTGVR